MKRTGNIAKEVMRMTKSLFTRNLGLKLLSLAIAILIYLALKPESNSKENIILLRERPGRSEEKSVPRIERQTQQNTNTTNNAKN